jgi:chromosome segregation ATPase
MIFDNHCTSDNDFDFFFQTADSVKFEIQKAMRERDKANHTTMQIRSDLEKLLLQSTQDSVQLRQQLNSTQTRLNDIENELLDSKKQCLDLTEEINRLTREVLYHHST